MNEYEYKGGNEIYIVFVHYVNFGNDKKRAKISKRSHNTTSFGQRHTLGDTLDKEIW